MARIRSIHPGMFTDEAFASLSMDARVLYVGLLTEADDKGVFEWKPITIKMRLFSADNLNVEPLLGELAQANMVRKYEAEGREYGAIRNFRKYQRPKFPNSLHPMPDYLRSYVALTPSITEMAADDDGAAPRKTEKSFQMEDGGGKRKKKEPIQEEEDLGGEGFSWDTTGALQ